MHMSSQRRRLVVAAALLLLLPLHVAALQLRLPLTTSRIQTTTTKLQYRVLDQEEEEYSTTRRRLRMPSFWKENNNDDELHQPNHLSEQQQQLASEQNKKKQRKSIKTVDELRQAILDDGLELKELDNDATETDVSMEELLNHEVISLLAKRFHEHSVPGHRSKDDTAKLALSIEGGGMRGAVSAGMASAVACLGLCDAFDAIYGASAGSIIGAYMVSRQMCVDVYTQVLPAAKQKFVCKKRLVASLAVSAMELLFRKTGVPGYNAGSGGKLRNPGMNISFVLDGIMDQETGLRPFDFESFAHNNVKQPLRVASSGVRGGQLESLCFGSDDFFSNNNSTDGLFACLQASMTVPGATGPPVPVWHDGKLKQCFDAFCFEPVPYRSAVAEGATHVLVLRSRPQGFVAKTKPGVYEKAVTPLYFATHGQPKVSEFFERGGQQYIYLEDILTLEQGKNSPQDAVFVPPADILYGVDPTTKTLSQSTSRDQWNKAHLLPITLPKGTLELSTLEQDQTKVLEAVRHGFSTAYDLLAPAIGLSFDDEMTGQKLAELVFPNDTTSFEEILETPLAVNGTVILPSAAPKRKGRRRRVLVSGVLNYARRKSTRVRSLFSKRRNNNKLTLAQLQQEEEAAMDATVASLLQHLPGIKEVPHLARGLQQERQA